MKKVIFVLCKPRCTGVFQRVAQAFAFRGQAIRDFVGVDGNFAEALADNKDSIILVGVYSSVDLAYAKGIVEGFAGGPATVTVGDAPSTIATPTKVEPKVSVWFLSLVERDDSSPSQQAVNSWRQADGLLEAKPT